MADLSMVFDLLARDRASSEVKKVGDSMDRAGDRAGFFGSTVGKAMGIAAGAVAAIGVTNGLTNFVTDAAESAKISRLTEAAIASTGGAAKISADQIGELATALSNKTAIDDEAIQSASNLLLTFTNVRNEAGEGNNIFDQATETALNMATAMGTDANGAAMQLGKALNDPVKGVTALGRAGVQFTADQKEQIAAMVESGNVLGAQRMILGELETQFGGAAAAGADPIARLTTIAGNLGEKVGGYLLPYVEQFSTWLSDKGLPYVERLVDAMQTYLPPAIDAVSTAFTTVKDVLQNDVWPALEAIGTWMQDHQTTVMVIGGLIGGFLAASFLVWGVRATVGAAMNVAAWFSALFAAQTSAAGQNLSAMQVVARWALMGAQAVLRGAWIATVWVAQTAIATGALLAGWTVAATRTLASWALMGAQALVNGIRIAAVWIAQTAITTGTMLVTWGIAAATVIGGWVLMGVQSLLQAARMAAAWLIAMGPVGWIIAAVVGLVALIIANWETVKTWTVNAFRAVVDFVVGAFRSIVSGVSNGISSVITFVKELPGKILSALGNLGTTLLTAGGDLLRGLWNGISNSIGWLKNKIMDWAGNLLPGWVKDILGIKSPSTVFAGLGRDTMRGFAVGIEDGSAEAIAAAADAAAAVTAAGSVADMGAGFGSGVTAYSPPRYDMPAAGGAAAGGASRTTYVSGVVGPEEVAAIVRRDQQRDEFLAGV